MRWPATESADASGSVVLRHPQGVCVVWRKIRLQVPIDVVGLAQRIELVEHAVCVGAPIGRFGQTEVVDAADLVQVHDWMRRVDDG